MEYRFYRVNENCLRVTLNGELILTLVLEGNSVTIDFGKYFIRVEKSDDIARLIVTREISPILPFDQSLYFTEYGLRDEFKTLYCYYKYSNFVSHSISNAGIYSSVIKDTGNKVVGPLIKIHSHLVENDYDISSIKSLLYEPVMTKRCEKKYISS